MSENNSISIYIPPGFAHGVCGLEKENYIIYSCSNTGISNLKLELNLMIKIFS